MDAHPVRHAADRDLTPVPQKEQIAIKDRGIWADTVNKYKVTVNTNPESVVGHVYPYFDEAGSHVANKVRRKGEKAFYWEGDVSSGCLFGQQLFPAGGKAITIVEGECDALAGFQLTGSRYPCVSIKSASEAKRNCVDNFEYLNSFEKIVICFDNDEPGQKAANTVAQLFAPGKVHILKLQHAKDANDYLMKGMEKEYVNEWFRAQPFRPDGLVFGGELLDSILNKPSPYSVPYPWQSLNDMTYGARLSELVLLMADTGSGKSTVIRETAYSLLTNPEVKDKGYKIGMLMLEEPIHDTATGLLSIHDNTPYHLPDTAKSPEMLTKAYKEVLEDNRIVLYDSFGSNDIDVIVAKIRHMAALGCKYIFLDHLSIIVSDGEGDERKLLDSISTKLKTLTIEQDIAVFCVIHTNRAGLARGSAGPEKVANMHFLLERDKQERDEWRRNVLKISVLKNRFSGKTGPVSWLHYSNETGRLRELSAEEIERYENGGTNTGNEFNDYTG